MSVARTGSSQNGNYLDRYRVELRVPRLSGVIIVYWEILLCLYLALTIAGIAHYFQLVNIPLLNPLKTDSTWVFILKACRALSGQSLTSSG